MTTWDNAEPRDGWRPDPHSAPEFDDLFARLAAETNSDRIDRLIQSLAAIASADLPSTIELGDN